MARDKQFEESVSKWLEESASTRLPERVLNATFERTRRSPQHTAWRGLLRRLHLSQFAFAVAGAAVLLVVVGLAAGLWVNRPGIGGVGSPTPPATPAVTPSPTPEPTIEPSPTAEPTAESAPSPEPTSSPITAAFVGTWLATDPPPESSHLTMDVVARTDGSFDLTIADDAAAVCQGISSTMTGVAAETEPGTIVIARPRFMCDDGSKPHSLDGQPMADLLRNYTLVYDAQADVLREQPGLVWSRAATGQ